jgi:hypothetical protein
MDYKLPPSLAIVVESEVLGKTAVSVPVSTDSIVNDGRVWLSFALDILESEVDALETRYVDSHQAGNEADVNIDIDTLRKAAEYRVLQGDRTWDAIAADCGWTRADASYSEGRRGDGQKVRELLGVAQGKQSTHRVLEYDDANALVKAIGLDPVDVGL